MAETGAEQRAAIEERRAAAKEATRGLRKQGRQAQEKAAEKHADKHGKELPVGKTRTTEHGASFSQHSLGGHGGGAQPSDHTAKTPKEDPKIEEGDDISNQNFETHIVGGSNASGQFEVRRYSDRVARFT